jgi:hypothetical protein
MIAAGKAGIEHELGLSDTCSSGQFCFQVASPSRAEVGTNAGTFYGTKRCASGCAGGDAGCYVFLSHDAAGWHYVNGRCVTAVEQIPSAVDQVYTDSGCVNVRDAPSLTGRVVDCLANGTQVLVDDAPAFAGGHIWWHLYCRGWMAHDFLVAPVGSSTKPAAQVFVNCPAPTPPFSPMISLSLDSGRPGSNVVAVFTGFPAGEGVALYWDSPNPYLGTPGPNADSQGHIELDTSAGSPVGYFGVSRLGPGPHQLCGDTADPNTFGSQQPFAAKACATFTVEAVGPPASASPSTQPVASATQVAIKTNSPKPLLTSSTLMLGLGGLGALLILVSGAALVIGRARRRRRRF